MSLNKVSSQLKPITFTAVPLIHTFLHSLPFFYDKKEAKRMDDNGELYNKSKGEFGNVSDCAQYYFLIQITKELIDQQIDLIDIPGILIFEADRRFPVLKGSGKGKLLEDKTQWVWEYLNEKYPYKNTLRSRWNPIFQIETKKISPNYCLNIEYFRKYIAYLKRQADLLYSLPQYLDDAHQQEKQSLFQKWEGYLALLDHKDYSLVDDRTILNNFKIEVLVPNDDIKAELEKLLDENKKLTIRNKELEVKQSQIDAISKWKEQIRSQIEERVREQANLEMQQLKAQEIDQVRAQYEQQIADICRNYQENINKKNQESDEKVKQANNVAQNLQQWQGKCNELETKLENLQDEYRKKEKSLVLEDKKIKEQLQLKEPITVTDSSKKARNNGKVMKF